MSMTYASDCLQTSYEKSSETFCFAQQDVTIAEASEELKRLRVSERECTGNPRLKINDNRRSGSKV